MKVLVASRNKVKGAAVHEAFARFLDETAEVILSENEVDSGVSSQPVSLAETATGALNRLSQIRKTRGYDYYVAIEGGVYNVGMPIGMRWYESTCAAISLADSEPSVAYGPAYPIPRRFVNHLMAGKDMNEAVAIETGIEAIGRGMGFNGWLTDNQIDRQKSSAEAVLLALHGLKHEIIRG